MSAWWTAAELKRRIDICEADTEAMVARHEKPELIESRRKGIEMLYLCLERARKEEMETAHGT